MYSEGLDRICPLENLSKKTSVLDYNIADIRTGYLLVLFITHGRTIHSPVEI
jgi:hypothetical protein